MIGYTVLGGYLGAGKTTLLNHLLKHNEDRRLALLINDFGDINIDAGLVESEDENQINLANGCICCSISDGYFDALESLTQMDPPPDHIVVEASGVADVHKLAQYGHLPNLYLEGCVVLADAETVRQKAEDKFVAQTVRRQLAAADLLVLNKIDLTPAEQVIELKAWLSGISSAPLVAASYGQVPLEVLFGLRHQQVELPAAGHAQFGTWSYSFRQPVAQQALEAFVAALPKQVVRAKGIVEAATSEYLEVQVVGQRRHVTKRASGMADSQLVVIGIASELPTKETR